MKTRIDFLNQLEFDVALKILECLDDPADVIRASGVSHFWHHFVISNQISKKLCFRLFPQLSSLVSLKDSMSMTKNSADLECNSDAEWKAAKFEHRCYTFLSRSFTTCATNECIAEPCSASSTDNYPQESILNTLYPWDKVRWGPCYWSSKGKQNSEVPETLVFKLLAKLCVIREINIKPFKAYFQPGSPIYSAKAVRFRTGHLRNPSDLLDEHRDLPISHPVDDRIVWTYTSPEFPMDPENHLQKFKLPEPVLCIGGYMQIQLLGRVQKQEMDDLYYICISHVKVLGEPLFPKLDIEILEPSSGRILLKYFPENQNQPPLMSRYGQLDDSRDNSPGNLEALEHLYTMLRVNEPFNPYEWDDDDDDIDNDFDYVDY